MRTQPLFLAYYESRNFDFEGVGSTPAEAVDVLVQLLRQHGREYEIDPEWFLELYENESSFRDELQVRELSAGSAYRDRELVEPDSGGDEEPDEGAPFFVLVGPSPDAPPTHNAGPFQTFSAAEKVRNNAERKAGWAMIVEQAHTP